MLNAEVTPARLIRPLVSCLMAISATACGGGVGVTQFLAFEAPVVALTNVRLIDGSGGPARDDHAVIIEGERITAVGPMAQVKVPPGARVLDLTGRTVLPGLVGMHDHLFYQMGSKVAVPAASSFAMLYLASGVTTIRTAGALDLDGDLRIKRLIDAGRQPGPTIHVSSPYLYAIAEAPDARTIRQASRWMGRPGSDLVQGLQSLRREELDAAINAAHERGLKVTGHLCAVGFQEAIGLGIDNLEHGLLVDTEFFSRKTTESVPGPIRGARRAAIDRHLGPSRPAAHLGARQTRRGHHVHAGDLRDLHRPTRSSIPARSTSSCPACRTTIAPSRQSAPIRTRPAWTGGAG